MNDAPKPQSFSSCPAPLPHNKEITLAHGGGGRLTEQLIERVFLPAFKNQELGKRHDGAVMEISGVRLAFSTDTHVVNPLFFPGGDIGCLAVYGTVNDLAMCGAKPLYLSAAFVLEEGYPINELEQIAQSMKKAAERAGVQIVTGDTKVVERGKGDGVYVTTAGIGLVRDGVTIEPSQIREGDAILISGDLGRHGMAIMSVREGLAFEQALESDCAPLNGAVNALLDAGLKIHCLRDLTRGGLATALVELAEASKTEIYIEEALIPVAETVRGACEILGLDPLYVANEGRFTCFLPKSEATRALDILRSLSLEPALIGQVAMSRPAQVIMKSVIGAERIVDRLSGEQLPRIC